MLILRFNLCFGCYFYMRLCLCLFRMLYTLPVMVFSSDDG